MAKKIFAPLLLLIFVIAITISIGQTTKADGEEKRIIKVAYVESENFMKKTEGGFSGYGVDYLEAIAAKGGWKYQYISGTWDECMRWVENGTADMMSMVQYTEERGQTYLFSNDAMGYEYGLIYTRDDADLYYQDYAYMNGMSIAMMPNTVFDARLDELQSIHGITLNRVYYDTINEVIKAMEASVTDLAMVGNILGYNGAKVVGRDDGVPYYCIMSKDNEELMALFDEAHRQTLLDDPGIQSRLYQRYYKDSKVSSGPLFTREEYEFIQNAGEVTIKVKLDMPPLCYERDGKLRGIFVDNLQLLAEISGLKLKIEKHSVSLLEDDLRDATKENYLVLRSGRALEYVDLGEGYIKSDTIIDTTMTYVKRIDDIGEYRDDYTFAITEDMKYYLPEMLKRDSEKFNITYYKSAEECLDAVAHGKADIAIQDEYIVSYLLRKPMYEDVLAEASGVKLTNDICLISTEKDSTLINVLNKTIEYVPQEDKENLVTLELKANAYKYTLEDVLYVYWPWMAMIALAVVGGVLIYTIFNHKLTKMKVQRTEYDILQRKTQQDELTGLYNKSYFYEMAKEMIEVSDKDMCIAIMDITNFKALNDLYGMENGDKLLRYIATELKKIVRQFDGIIARFNADHFYICIPAEAMNEQNFPKRFKKTVLDDTDVSVTYGVYLVGSQKDVPVNIMCDRASMAKHDKTHTIAGYIQYYSDEDRSRIVKQKEIEGDMEEALEQRQFCVYVQPKYDVYNKEIIGGEALARWIHPDKGMISPGDFIPIFEKNGFIRFLDYYIWEETCKVLADLKRKNANEYPVSINVSRAHFHNNELADKLMELIDKYNLEPKDLELEITETICAEDSGMINSRIKKLQEMGFKIAMDDFGSGYSSLNMLKEIPLDIIKMDLKFLDSKENVEKSHKILGTLVELAKSLDLNVVVEGVETKEQVEFLESFGAITAQGFYFSRPVDSDTYEKMIISTAS